MANTLKAHKLKLREVNRHLVCRLCRGYFVDATTIAECLHSFCRSCIIKYLEKNSFCPICEVQIHKTKPYLNLRLDKALQDVVYKLVPGLYHSEMARRRAFYAKHEDLIPLTTPEERGVQERLIFSPEDSISLSLEYMDCPEPDSGSISSRSSESGEDFPLQLGLMKVRRRDSTRKESVDSNEPGLYPKRYLQCPAVVSVGVLKKFIAMKFDLSSSIMVELIHKRMPLPDHYTLMDVAYIFTWKRMEPMRFFYQLFEIKKEKVNCPVAPVTDIKQEKTESITNLVKLPSEKVMTEKPLKVPADSQVKKESTPPAAEDLKKPVEKPSEVKKEVNPVNGVKEEMSKKKSDVKSVTNLKAMAKTTTPTKEVLVNGSSEKVDESDIKKKSVKTDLKKVVPNLIHTPVLPKDTNSKTQEKAVRNLLTQPKTPLPTTAGSSPKPTKDAVKQVVQEKKDENPAPKDEKKNGIATKAVEKKETARISSLVEKLKQFQEKKETEKLLAGEKRKLAAEKESETTQPVEKKVKQENTDKKINEKFLLNPVSGQLERVLATPEKKSKVVDEAPRTVEGKIGEEKSNLGGLKTFRKDKYTKSKYSSLKSPLSITTASAKEKEPPKANVSIEIRDKKDGSEYDFDSVSPTNRIMSLQEYTQSEMYKAKAKDRLLKLKEELKDIEDAKKNIVQKKKTVPLLHRINTESQKGSGKTNEGKVEGSNTRVINIQTPPEPNSPPKPIKIENKGGEYSIKKDTEIKQSSNDDSVEMLRLLLLKRKDAATKNGNANKSPIPEKKPKTSPVTSPKTATASPPKTISLTQADPAPKLNNKNPLENLMEMAKKPTESSKKDSDMLNVLISVAQKQSIEPLLKVPQYPQTGNTNQPVTPTAINQALQFFQKLSSEMEARSQAEQNIPPKTPNFITLQQFYQQQIEVVRMLKRQHAMNAEANAAMPKTSPNQDGPKNVSKDETVLKNVERTLSQIQEQAEIQSRIAAAQNLKNMPSLLPYFSHPGSPLFRPPGSPPTPVPGQGTFKSSQLSPHGQSSPTEAQRLLSHQQQLFNTGLTPEMSYHQMFQRYIQEQMKMNQRKPVKGKRMRFPTEGQPPSEPGSSPVPSESPSLPQTPLPSKT